MSFNICLVSSNEIFREGLLQILRTEGFSVVGSVEDVAAAEDAALSADTLLLVDCPSPEDPLAAVEAARARAPSARIVVLADGVELRAMTECFGAGAQGFIIRTIKSARIVAALRLAALGEKVIPSDIVDQLGNTITDRITPAAAEEDVEAAKLSPRELDVLCCLMAGYSNKLIARKLDLCEATIKVHVKAILRKLEVQNRTQAALWANSRHLPEPVFVS